LAFASSARRTLRMYALSTPGPATAVPANALAAAGPRTFPGHGG
jgi:hypothetical protein